jgi:FkbM family methyltransferase
MKKRIFDSTLSLLSKATKKKVVYFTDSGKGLFAAVKSKYGFWYCGDITDQSDIAYGVASKGIVEAADTEIVMKVLSHLPPQFVFYDVGSNTGWYTMVSFTASTESNVYSFEPLEEHVVCQKETIALNRRENQTTVFELALSDHNGKEIIRLGGSGTSLDKDFLEVDYGTREITVATLDSVMEAHSLPAPHFIKIDVEGHEYSVLKGAKTALKAKPVLFIEVAKTLNNKRFVHKEYDALFSLLSSLHYKPFIVTDKGLKPHTLHEEVDGVHMFLFLNEDSHIHNKALTKDLGIR